MSHKNLKLAIIGLGYVGLPLAAEFAKSRNVIGFDINKDRIKELQKGYDRTNELSSSDLSLASNLKYTWNINDLKKCNCYIITVPTPINELNEPDLSSILSATSLIGSILSKGDLVIYESTVYPGLTEEVCAPILSKQSGLSYATKKFPADSDVFYLGYSPERINPGDKKHRISDIVKVTAGSTPEIAKLIDQLYKSIIKAGTYMAENILIAEAAKIIENTQRDLNIALINEFSIILKKLGIDTEAVLKAAGTKWNFLPFRPGLVGGHCIGVDPYYLAHKAIEIGYTPEIILSGRKINDEMVNYTSEQIITLMQSKNINVFNARILVLGLTFKENCPDIRNSKVINMVEILCSFKCKVDIYDPLVNQKLLPKKIQSRFITEPKTGAYDTIILAVKHNQFTRLGAKKIREYGNSNHVFFDMKYAFKADESDGRL